MSTSLLSPSPSTMHQQPSNTSSNNAPNSKGSVLMKQAADLNEDGVYHLSSGNSSQAIETLHASLQLLCDASTISVCSPRSAAVRQTIVAAQSAACRAVEIPYLQGELFSIYPFAMTYEHSDHDTIASHTTTGPCELQLLVFQRAVVLFNLALACHQLARAIRSKEQHHLPSRSSQRESCLRQALVYYQECDRVLQSLQECCNSRNGGGDDDWIVMTSLAVTNNQAQILHDELPQLQGSATARSSVVCEEERSMLQKLWHSSVQVLSSLDASCSHQHDHQHQ